MQRNRRTYFLPTHSQSSSTHIYVVSKFFITFSRRRFLHKLLLVHMYVQYTTIVLYVLCVYFYLYQSNDIDGGLTWLVVIMQAVLANKLISTSKVVAIYCLPIYIINRSKAINVQSFSYLKTTKTDPTDFCPTLYGVHKYIINTSSKY